MISQRHPAKVKKFIKVFKEKYWPPNAWYPVDYILYLFLISYLFIISYYYFIYFFSYLFVIYYLLFIFYLFYILYSIGHLLNT